MKFDDSMFDPMDLYRAIELAPTQNIYEEIDYRAQVIPGDTFSLTFLLKIEPTKVLPKVLAFVLSKKYIKK